MLYQYVYIVPLKVNSVYDFHIACMTISYNPLYKTKPPLNTGAFVWHRMVFGTMDYSTNIVTFSTMSVAVVRWDISSTISPSALSGLE